MQLQIKKPERYNESNLIRVEMKRHFWLFCLKQNWLHMTPVWERNQNWSGKHFLLFAYYSVQDIVLGNKKMRFEMMAEWLFPPGETDPFQTSTSTSKQCDISGVWNKTTAWEEQLGLALQVHSWSCILNPFNQAYLPWLQRKAVKVPLAITASSRVSGKKSNPHQ